MRFLYIFVFTIVTLLSGVLIHNLLILDSCFGLAYYALDILELWKSGPTWVRENKMLSVFCFLIFPILISLLCATFVVIFSEKIFKHSKYSGLLFVTTVLILIFGLQSPPQNRISFFLYWTSNY